MRREWLFVAAMVVLGCRSPAEPSRLVTMTVAADSGGVTIRLLAAPGARINARRAPVLELADRTQVNFDRGAVDRDGEYFVEPPVARIPSARSPLDGILRIGICPAGLEVCQFFEMPVIASVVEVP